MSHGPVEAKHRELLNALAHAIDDLVNGGKDPKEVGFVLLMFDFGEPDRSRMNYISNGRREDIIASLHELLARFEGRMPDTEGHA